MQFITFRKNDVKRMTKYSHTIMILINVVFGYLLNPMPVNEIDFYYAWLCVPEE